MPSVRRSWCPHPYHLQTFPDGTKIYTKFGPKPNHPVGSRRISSSLAKYINKTCLFILNDPSLKVDDNQSLCTTCYEEEMARFQTNKSEEMDIYIDQSDSEEEVTDSEDLIRVERDYAVDKLNEVFKFFQLEPVIP
jgi:hypothetical protein